MQQSRLSDGSYRLSDGTDISRMTADEIMAAQRRLSPKFPDILTAYQRRQRDRENLAARILLWGFVPGGLITLPWSSFGWVVAGFGLVGFISTCLVAGARAHDRAGGSGGRPC